MHVASLLAAAKRFETRVRRQRLVGFWAAMAPVLPAALLIICMAGFGLAQNTNSGDIRGTVTDTSGAVVPGVTVKLLNIDTGVAKELVTNSVGLYDAVSILPGRYKITFAKEGFGTVVRDGIILDVGAISVDVQLTVGVSQQEVVVTANAAQLKTETAEQATDMVAESMVALPNVGQDWQNFVKLLPGATGTPASGAGVANPGIGVAVNGTMPYYSSYVSDGASIRLPHSANIDSSLIFESVAEVQINTSTFGAQFGGGGNVFNIISKSGSNQWHGSAYEYLQNDALNARSFFDQQKARQRYNNYGGSVSGPIVKNKAFFFYDVDKIVNPNSSTQTASVPTQAMAQGVFDPTVFGTISDPTTGTPFPNNTIPQPRMDKVALAIQGFFPQANLPGLIQNNYRLLVPASNPQMKQFGRLDLNLSSQNRLTFSITEHGNHGGWGGVVSPMNLQTSTGEGYNAQISDVHTFGPSVVNEFRWGFVRQGNWFLPGSEGKGYPAKLGWQFAAADVFPNINIGGTGGNNTLNPQTSAIYIENSWSPSDTVTMIRGKHILHFGGEILMEQDNSTPWGNLNAGSFNFSGQFTNSNVGYADFLLGQVQSWSALVQGEAGMRSKNPSLFLQDDIKVRPNLTLNVGLRWEGHGGFSEVHDLWGTFDPTLPNPATKTPGAILFGANSGRSDIMASVNNVFFPALVLPGLRRANGRFAAALEFVEHRR